jgi:hypothetical protein
MNVTYDIRTSPLGRFIVVRVKPYRDDIVGSFTTREVAEAEIRFQQSLDDDKLRDLWGRL